MNLESVDTSDSEEREALDATSQSYWNQFVATEQACPEIHSSHSAILRSPDCGLRPVKTTCSDGDFETPRKRIKLEDSTPSSPHVCSSVSPETISIAPDTPPGTDVSALLSESSSVRSSPVTTPIPTSRRRDSSEQLEDTKGDSEGEWLLPTQDCVLSRAIGSQDATTSPLTMPSSSGPKPSSPSPPAGVRPAYPSDSEAAPDVSQAPIPQIINMSTQDMNLETTASSYLPPSPISQTSSPKSFRQSPAQIPLQSNSPSPLALLQPSNEPPGQHDGVEPADQGRYRLRARVPKQLKPYGYDRVLYKFQMRANPDAIVKLVSPKRGARKEADYVSDTQESETEGYWVVNDREKEEDIRREAERKRRALRASKGTHDGGREEDNTDGHAKWSPFLLPEDPSDDEDDENTRTLTKEIETKRQEAESRRLVSKRKRSVQFSPRRLTNAKSPDLISNSTTRHTSLHPFSRGRSPETPASGSDDVRATQDLDETECRVYTPERERSFESSDVNDSRTVVSSMEELDAHGGASSPDEDNSGGSVAFDEKSYQQFRAWRRMQPAVMINKQISDSTAVKRSGRLPSKSAQLEHDEADRPLLPGQTRVRTGKRRDHVEIKGDTESSDSERSIDVSQDGLDLDAPSLFDEAIEVVRSGQAKAARSRSSRLSSGSYSDEEAGSSSAEVDACLQQHPHATREEAQEVVRRRMEDDMIDWMLTGTRNVDSVRISRPRKSRTGRKKPAKVSIVTAAAQKYGPERQSVLPFKRVTASAEVRVARETVSDPSASSSSLSTPQWREQIHGPTTAVTSKKRRLPRATGAYTFTSRGVRLSSGQQVDQNITVDLEDEDLNQALAAHDYGRRRTNNHSQSNTPAPTSRFHLTELDDQSTHTDLLVSHLGNAAPDTWPKRRSAIKADFGLQLLPSGISFDRRTYLGQGRLYELIQLIQSTAKPPQPSSFEAHGIAIGPSTTVNSFLESLVTLSDRLSSLVVGPRVEQGGPDIEEWQGLLHTVCQLVSWLASQEQDQNTLQAAVRDCVQQIIKSITGSTMPRDAVIFTVLWFCVDVSIRVECGSRKQCEEAPLLSQQSLCPIRLLARELHAYRLENVMRPLQEAQDKLETRTTPQLAVQSWICLIHVLGTINCAIPDDKLVHPTHPFWRIISELICLDFDRFGILEASETAWNSIFGLCALSQFSVHGMTTSNCRLPCSWQLVAFILGQIKISADRHHDQALTDYKLKDRDAYIRILTHRCFLLWEKWKWKLDEADPMLKWLADIFRSRKFVNLLEEPSDFAPFMRKYDVGLLSRLEPQDSAFDVFLKLIVQSGSDSGGEVQRMVQLPRARKLLSLAIPVGSLLFSRMSPPTGHELSMLYNRFSAIAVAINMDPNTITLQKRIDEARRYVHFRDADYRTRVVCIRSVIYYAYLSRRHRMSLEYVLSWLGDMADNLVDEYQTAIGCAKSMPAHGKHNMRGHAAVNAVEMVLASVRHIVAMYMDPSKAEPGYPDPALLEGSWLTRVLNIISLSNLVATQIRKLVQAYLDARVKAIGPPPPPYFPAASDDTGRENSESQDEFAELDLELDFNDPGIGIALGDKVVSNDLPAKEKRVCEVIRKHIFPDIYRSILCMFKDLDGRAIVHPNVIDEMVDCWVSCATVLVTNGKRDWSTFLTSHGLMSWQNIEHVVWRRRVGLRFMLTLLRLAPIAYKEEQNLFLNMLIECLVVPNITIEHEYTSRLFSVDGLRHMLLSGVPCQPAQNFKMSRQEFLDMRFATLNVVLSNLALKLRKAANEEETALSNLCKIWVQSVAGMFSTMRRAFEEFPAGSRARGQYLVLCQRVSKLVNEHAELKTQHHLQCHLEWANALSLCKHDAVAIFVTRSG